MTNERRLNDCMVLENYWRDATEEMLAWGWDTSSQVEFCAEFLLDQVNSKNVSVAELRAGVSWANALDREAVEQTQLIDLNEADCLEASARRLVHHAGRMALEQVKSRHRRLILEVKNHRAG